MRLRELLSVGLRRLIELTPAHARAAELLRFNAARGSDRVRYLLRMPCAKSHKRGVIGSAVGNPVPISEILWRSADSRIPATPTARPAALERQLQTSFIQPRHD